MKRRVKRSSPIEGYYRTKAEATKVANRLKKKGFGTRVVYVDRGVLGDFFKRPYGLYVWQKA